MTNNFNNTVTELTGAGTNVTGSPTSAGSMNSPLGIGIDATNTVWVANSRNNSITRLVSSGSSISGTNITTGGLNRPNAIAPDGGNLIWVANLNSSVSEFTQSGAALSPSSGFIRGVAINAVYSLAIDGSGNIWIPYSHGNTVTEIIGSGTPTVTPAAAALSSPYNAAVARP